MMKRDKDWLDTLRSELREAEPDVPADGWERLRRELAKREGTPAEAAGAGVASGAGSGMTAADAAAGSVAGSGGGMSDAAAGVDSGMTAADAAAGSVAGSGDSVFDPAGRDIPAARPARGSVMRLSWPRIVAAAAVVLVGVVAGELLWHTKDVPADDGAVLVAADGSGGDAARPTAGKSPDALDDVLADATVRVSRTEESAPAALTVPTVAAVPAVPTAPAVPDTPIASGARQVRSDVAVDSGTAQADPAATRNVQVASAASPRSETSVTRTRSAVAASGAAAAPETVSENHAAEPAAVPESSTKGPATGQTADPEPVSDAFATGQAAATAADASAAPRAAGTVAAPESESGSASRRSRDAAKRRTSFVGDEFVAYAPPRKKASFGLYAGGGVTGGNGADGGFGRRTMSSDVSSVVGNGDKPVHAQRTDFSDGSFRHHQPLGFGISVSREFAYGLSLESGVSYTLLRSDVRLRYATEDVSQRLHFIGVPLRLNWQFLRRGGFSLYIGAGGMAEKCVSAKFGSEIVDEPGVQWSVHGMLGAEYRFGSLVGLYFEPECSRYFTATRLQTVRTESAVSLALRMGVRFSF